MRSAAPAVEGNIGKSGLQIMVDAMLGTCMVRVQCVARQFA